MSAGVIGSTVLLVLAVVLVGLVLQLRRHRSGPDGARPRTVGDLVRLRSRPAARPREDAAGPESDAAELPATAEARPAASPEPAAPRTAAGAPEPVTHGATARPVDVPVPPPGEFGDAPWRRADRMMGKEPGAGWDTAPVPAAPVTAAPVPAVSQPAPSQPAEPPARPATAPAPRPATPSTPRPAPPAVPQQVAASVAAAPATPPPAARPAPRPAPEPPTVELLPPARTGAAGPERPSRPLSDPDLTPLMGIPVVRPGGSENASRRPSPRAHGSGLRPAPLPSGSTRIDPEDATPTDPTPVVLVEDAAPEDEVVALLLPASAVVPPPVRTGSPQPVWFRVVRRDGEPVAGVLVALLDDHGQEVDATKTASDGGGELSAPHAGRFLMIASSDGFQPRAALLAVEGQPVELALLLPRSATVAGVVRSAGRPVTGARVVARQEGEIVDDLVTGRDGAYRFPDLAEGAYVLSATDHRGAVARDVTLHEGADAPLDLDLEYRDGAR